MRWKLLVGIAALALSGAAAATAQTRIITGRVTDSLSNDVVTSGQVAVQGTTIGTTIRDDGTFTLGAPARDVTLVIRSIGFKRAEIAVPVSQNSVQVPLARDYFQLEAIVVTGQATGVERKNLANAVASVDAQSLVRASTASVEQSLMGKVASAQIQDLGGGPGGGVLVTLRGTTSLNNAYTPLYVVDGIVVSDAKIPRGINRLTRATGALVISTDQEQPINRVADLNPDDILSVEVLKGASASAIYGSRASNGVILITTKRGRIGAPQFTVSQKFGTSRRFRKVGSRVFGTLADAEATWPKVLADQYWSTTVYDNEEEVAGNVPFNYETALSVSGGTETTRYYASGLVRHEGGIVWNTYASKQSLRLNLDQDIGPRVQLNLSSDVVHNANDRGLTGNDNANVSYWAGLNYTPSFFDLRATCPDGSRQNHCVGGTYAINPFTNSNPLATMYEAKEPESVWRSILNSKLQITAVQSPEHTLTLIGNGGVDFFHQKNEVYSPPDLQYENIDGFLGTSVLSFGEGIDGNLNGNAVYRFAPSGGSLTATTSAGVQYESRGLNVGRTLNEGLVGGLQIITSGTHVVIDQTKERTNDLGFFGQEEVLIKNRLNLTAGIRADQSSNNSDASKLYYYPKAAMSYRFPSLLPGLVDELKLRAAIGESGNEPNYQLKFSELNSVNIAGVPAHTIASRVAAPDVRPERQREIEAGVDATLLGSRANLELTVYDKHISDLLLTRSLAPVTGFTTQIFNGGVMRTRGLEAGLNMIPLQTRSVQWNTNVNFFMSRSKILSLPVPTFRQSSSARYGTLQIEVGKSPTQVIAWVPADPANPLGARMDAPIGDYNPDYKVSWASDLTFKRLKLYWLFDHYQGGWIHNYTELLYDFAGNTKDYADPVPAGSPLAPYGTQKGPARIKAGTTNCSSCAWMQPMTYTKLREASLSLDLPTGFVHRFWSGARYVRASLSGRNLLILTGYRGSDPEVLVRASTLYTQWRSDIWPYIPYRSYWLSVDVGF